MNADRAFSVGIVPHRASVSQPFERIRVTALAASAYTLVVMDDMVETRPWHEPAVLTLDWDKPPRDRYAALPDEAVRKGKELLAALRAQVSPLVQFAGDWARWRTRGRFHEEVRALAERLGESWRVVMAGNLTYDLVLASYGCSTMALATPDGPVLARNMDWRPETVLAKTTYLIRAERKTDLVFASAGWPGAVGVVTGLSGRGFAVALNAVAAPQGISPTGYPVLLHLRRVVEEAEDFDDAVRRLVEEHLTAGCLLTVVGRENDQRVVIERTPRRAALRRPVGSEPLLTTNHYRAMPGMPPPPDNAEGTCPRFARLCALWRDRRHGETVSDEDLLTMLTDAEVMQEFTVHHIIIRPRAGSLRAWVPGRLLNA
ncbi:MAG: hypothetical protein D6788_11840 [Planctomycetota bacterium]|nr:MAG: hypothetical protein D6788_11840 [Planctomycetota bacterium]